MRVFKVLDDKSIVKADSRLFWTLFFSMIALSLFGVKWEFLKFWKEIRGEIRGYLL